MSKTHIFYITIILAGLCFSGHGYCEFYRYVDQNGHAVYVDDPASIPARFRHGMDKYLEEHDNLSENEKKALKAEKELQSQQRRAMRDQDIEAEKTQRSIQQAARELRKKINDAKKDFDKKKKTRIQEDSGQIIVPIQIGATGKKASARFILDTGASMTVVYQSIADKLGITGGRSVEIQVVGGGIIPAKFTTLEFIEVGPYKKHNVPALVIKNQGPANHHGLLGMQFLKGLEFSIDYNSRYIIWGPDS